MKKVLITALVVLGLVLAVSCTTNYTVKFMNGDVVYNTQSVPAGGVVVEPVSPEKEGYTFDAWYTDSTYATKYDFNTKVNSSFNLYAKFDKNPAPIVYYNVSFDTDGGTPVPNTQIVESGKYATEPTEVILKDGYAFVGWFAEDGETPFDFEKTAITADTVIYAEWLEIPASSYKVVFNTNGGLPVPKVQIVEDGGYAECPTTSPAKKGYTFEGWFADEECETAFNFNEAITADTIVYAKWDKIDIPVVTTYKVAFETDGGTPVPEVQYVIEGECAVCPVINPEKVNYAFGGWYTTDGSTKVRFDFNTPITNDTVIYASWVYSGENAPIVVSFEMNGGTPQVASQTIPYGGSAVKPEDPTKDGYDFVYWANANGDKYSFGSAVYASTVLHAVWSEGHYEGFLVSNGYIYGISTNYATEVMGTKKLVIPDGIKGIGDSNIESGLKSVLDNVYDYESAGGGVFRGWCYACCGVY